MIKLRWKEVSALQSQPALTPNGLDQSLGLGQRLKFIVTQWVNAQRCQAFAVFWSGASEDNPCEPSRQCSQSLQGDSKPIK